MQIFKIKKNVEKISKRLKTF